MDPRQSRSVEPTLELRDIKISSDGPTFQLYDTETGLDRWVRLDDTHRGFKVTQYRPAENSLTLVSRAHVITLVLSQRRLADASYLLPAPPPSPSIADGRERTAALP